jgi:hypothetical protein
MVKYLLIFYGIWWFNFFLKPRFGDFDNLNFFKDLELVGITIIKYLITTYSKKNQNLYL